jgi:hypothetical protein
LIIFVGLVIVLLVVIAGILFLRRSGGPSEVAQSDTSMKAAVEVNPTGEPEANFEPASAAGAASTADWLAADDDQDGLTNGEELAVGSLPDKADTDEDGLSDFEEVSQYGSDPLKSDTDGDALRDGDELSRGLNPLTGDTDNDGVPDNSDSAPNIPAGTQTAEAQRTAELQTAEAQQALAAQTAEAEATGAAMAEATAAVMATETAAAQASETAIAAERATQQAAANAPRSGVFNDFETAASWRRGDEANGTFTQSTAQAHGGSSAGQLDYSFTSPGNDYVVFSRRQPLAGEPRSITAWVYGDNSTHFLNIWVQDREGEIWQFSFGRIEHSGWQQMSAPLDPAGLWPVTHIDGPSNSALDYPISFQAIVLDDAPDDNSGSGVIYLDDLTSQ